VTVIDDVERAQAGDLLGGRFRLSRGLGSQAGTSLWQATDELLCRPVAVHLLPAGIPAGAQAGLAAAVQAAARIGDVRLTAVYDACYDPARPYLISEWAGEPDVERLLLTELPSPALAALVVTEAAQALAAAHAGGRPHLCLTPRSLHWGRNGLKITGLGIDAALTGADLAGWAMNGRARTDTEALGRILFALLTGYWPGEVSASALRTAPRSRVGLDEPGQLRPRVPAQLNAIVCRALPDEFGWGPMTIQTPAELAAALRPARSPYRMTVPYLPAPELPPGHPSAPFPAQYAGQSRG